MAVWETCKVTGTDPGSRIQIDAGGHSSVRLLSQSFRSHDTVDFGTVGRGAQLVFGGVESITPGTGTPTYYILGF